METKLDGSTVVTEQSIGVILTEMTLSTIADTTVSVYKDICIAVSDSMGIRQAELAGVLQDSVWSEMFGTGVTTLSKDKRVLLLVDTLAVCLSKTVQDRGLVLDITSPEKATVLSKPTLGVLRVVGLFANESSLVTGIEFTHIESALGSTSSLVSLAKSATQYWLCVFRQINGILDIVDEDEELANLSEYDSSIQMATDQVMEVYTQLFSSGYELARPVGLLTPSGLLTLKDDRLLSKGDSQLKELYGTLTSNSNFSIADESTIFSSQAVRDHITYFPALLLSFAYGRRVPKEGIYRRYYKQDKSGANRNDWRTYSEYLEKQVASLLNDVVKEAGTDTILQSICTALTNCILVVEFNARIAIKCRMTNLGEVNKSYCESAIRNGLFQRRGSVEFFSEKRNISLKDLTIVFDMQKFSGFPIFAFQALEVLQDRGEKPSWNKVLLGRGMDDKIYTHNFADDKFTTNIVAGSGSGKGVMTLNILAAALGDNIPVFYNDCKPDMAKTLHDIGRGLPIYAYDAKAPKWDSSYEGDAWKATVPPEIVPVLGSGFINYGALSYVKSMQLNLLIARLRTQDYMTRYGLNRDQLGGKRCVFIWDEFLAFNGFLEGLVVSLKTAVSLIDSKERKQHPVYLYYTKIKDWLFKVTKEVTNFFQADGRFSDVNLITLFQEVNGVSIESFKETELFRSALKNQNGASKLLGRGVSTGYEGTLGMKGTAEFTLIEGQRYFGYTSERQCKEASKMDVFKPYLILNTTDESHPCMTGIRQTEGIEDIIGATGSADERIALEGYVNSMLGDSSMSERLSSSYGIAQNVLSLIGFSGSVEDYLYDYSIESFKTIDDLTANIGGGDLNLASSSVGFSDDTDTLEEVEGITKDCSPDYSVEEPALEPEIPTHQFDMYGERAKQVYTQEHPSEEDWSEPEETDLESEEDEEYISSEEVDEVVSPTTVGVQTHSSEALDTPLEELRRENEELRESMKTMQDLLTSFMKTGDMPSRVSRAEEELVNKELDQDKLTGEPFTFNLFGRPFKVQRFDKPLDFGEKFTSSSDFRDSARSFQDISRLLLDEVSKMFGGLDRVTELAVVSEGIIINGVSFEPKLSEEYVSSLPLDVQNSVREGRFGWLFHFGSFRRMKNISTLFFDDVDFLFKKVRIDLGMGSRFEPKDLFDICRKLANLQVGEFVFDRITKDSHDEVFHASRRSTEIADAVDGFGWGLTTTSWGNLRDTFKSKEKRGIWKGLSIAGWGGATAVTGTSSALFKLGRAVTSKGSKALGNLWGALKENR